MSVTVTVNGSELEVADGTTILQAAKVSDAWIPTLCFDERQAPFGACRVCMVHVEGAPKPLPACTTPCRDGMVIDTDDATARRVATAVVELVLSELPTAPEPHTELAQVADRLEITDSRWPGATHELGHDFRHPYLAFQHELCISCGRCVRACDEVQGAFALTATGRGFQSNITAGLDAGFEDSSCVSCGACADTCPTDAITEITLLDGVVPDRPPRSPDRGGRKRRPSPSMSTIDADRFDKTVTTTCGYCGVGCRLEAHARQGRIVSISPADDGPANEGHTCLKGRFAHQFTRSRDRLTSPLIREHGELRVASWDEALQRIASELTRIKDRYGPDAIAGLASSRATNEDCYAMQRLIRAAIGTNNIDNCSRVCHSPTSFAMRKSFGLSGATGSFTDIDHADVAVLIGVNPTAGHPVVGARIKQAALKGCKLVTIDPRRIELADYGVLHLAPRPGTNAAVVLGLSHVIRRDGLTDETFIAERTEGYDALEELLELYTPQAVEEISGIPAAKLEQAAHLYGEAGTGCLLWGLGVTEHKYGSEVVQMLCNLAMMTGKVGKRGSALLPLRGQNNVQGSSDMGALPDTYTAYRRVDDEETAELFEQAWGVPLSRKVGYKIPEMFDAAVAGDLKAMYVFGEDIAQTDPDTAHVQHALESLEFMVCQEIFENETTKYADVVLPASAFLEKCGTFVNAERRFQLVEASIDPPGGARTDFDIITTVSRMLGHEMGWTTPWDALDEVARLTPHYAGVSYERLGRTGLQWPVHADGKDSPTLYDQFFDRPGGRGAFAALPYKAPGDAPDREFPLVLVTGRVLQHYNAGTMTRRTGNADLVDRDWLEIHPDDADRLWISEGDTVSIRSRVGATELDAKITDRIERGHVFTTFHFPETRTNLLIGQSADVNTSCPEYKVVAVDVRPIAEQPAFTPQLSGVS